MPTKKNTQTKLIIGTVQAGENTIADSSEGAADGITAMIDVPAGVLEIGSFVGVKVSAPTQEYDSCIPISALNVAEKGKYYVNVLEKKPTVQDRNGLFTKEMWNYCLKMKNMQQLQE